MKLYSLCCGYRAVWRSRTFWVLFLLVVILTTTQFWSSPHDNKKMVDVYVVEEHHEALRYWHHLTVVNRMNRTGNTLIHIDAHSDMATPQFLPEVPAFKWPVGEQQLFMLLQKNDVFIQGAAIIGMLDHIMWIYPSWDKQNEFNEYNVFLFEIGILSTKTDADNNKIFCECHTPVNKHTHEVMKDAEAECSYLDESKAMSEMDVKIKKEDCQIKRKLMFEVIIDELALEVFEKSAWVYKPNNVILDIDEDYFGCERGGTPLEKVSTPWSVVQSLDVLINDLVCAKNPIHEEAGDKMMKDLVASLIDICRLTGYNTCNISTLDIVDLVKEPVLKQFSLMPRLFCHDKSLSIVLLQRIIEVLKRLKYSQLVALAELGFCMNTSPATLGFAEGNAEFKICHGANTPNDTVVVIYTPDQDEVTRRMSLLQSILKYVTDMEPNIVTLCRSVRDGYTPRHLAKHIEVGIMDFFAQNHKGIKFNVIYDDNLLGGIQGWQGRYKTYIK